MCYTAIPGQTGYLAARGIVLEPRKKKVIQIQSLPAKAAKPEIRVMYRDEPSFVGGPLGKTMLSWQKGTDKYYRQKRNLRATNARQHSRLRPKRKTIRRNFRPI